MLRFFSHLNFISLHNTLENVRWRFLLGGLGAQDSLQNAPEKQSNPRQNSLQPQSALLVISVGQYFAVQMYWQLQAKILCVLGPGFVCVLLAVESFVHAYILHKTQHCPWMDTPQLLRQLPASSSAPSLPTAQSSDYTEPLSLQGALLQ